MSGPGAPATARTFTIDVPFARVARSLADPRALATALVEADARTRLAELIDAGGDRSLAIVFGDVEGFTPLTERLGDDAAAGIVGALDALVGRALSIHGGLRLKSTGDGFMAVFGDVPSALRAAAGIQRSLAAPAGEDVHTRVRLRVGVHFGAVVPVSGADGRLDVAGRAVIVASRISDHARGGEALVSAAVRRAVAPTGEFRFGRIRRVRLKGLTGVHRVAELDWRSLTPTSETPTSERRVP
jgi:class 3 adenylate cyclase